MTILKHAFGTATERIYLRTRPDGKLFKVSRLKAKTRVQEVCLRDFLLADDAAVTAHTEEDLQRLMRRFTVACENFGLTIRLHMTPVTGQDVGVRATFHQHPRVRTSKPSVSSPTWAQQSRTPSPHCDRARQAQLKGSYYHTLQADNKEPGQTAS